jgi:tetratricopeptide (TPR) repeat protein
LQSSGKFSKIGVFGSLFFLVAIAPVSQILPVGLVIPADRYTYVPYIGLFYIFAQGFNRAYGKYDKKILLWAISLLFAGLFVLTFTRTLVYRGPITICDDVIKNYSNIPLAYYNRGDEYYLKRNEPDRALLDFQKAIDIDPKYVEAYINMGLIYYFKNDPHKAIAYYEKAFKISDTMPETYMNRGNSYSHLGREDLALKDYNAAIKLRPTYVEAWYNRGNIYLKKGDFKNAISDYSHAIKLNRNYPDAFNNRGNAYFRMGDLDNAYLDFSQAIWLNPYKDDAYYNRAVVSSMKGDAASALSDVLKSQKLGNPVDPAVIEKLKRAVERE